MKFCEPVKTWRTSIKESFHPRSFLPARLNRNQHFKITQIILWVLWMMCVYGYKTARSCGTEWSTNWPWKQTEGSSGAGRSIDLNRYEGSVYVVFVSSSFTTSWGMSVVFFFWFVVLTNLVLVLFTFQFFDLGFEEEVAPLVLLVFKLEALYFSFAVGHFLLEINYFVD